MLKTIEEIGVTSKLSFTAIVSSVGTTTASFFGWFSENIVAMSAMATFFLTVIMAFSYILDQTRKNRAERIDNVKKELEIEMLRRELEKQQH